MTDIVQWLRDIASGQWAKTRFESTGNKLREAAGEIERLRQKEILLSASLKRADAENERMRAALTRISKANTWWDGDIPVCQEEKTILVAKAALGEET